MLLHKEELAPPYTSLDLARNILSDRLWMPLVYIYQASQTIVHILVCE